LVGLWFIHSHAHAAARVSPILAIRSPEKRCGKTTTLTLATALVNRALPASNITSAALFRAVEKYQPTLLIDEADSFLRDREELRGVINSGHTRATAMVIRTVGDDFEPKVFSTWAPKAIALIGDLPGTIEDRSVVLTLRRRRPDEQVEELRLDRLESLAPLRSRIARWTADHIEELRHADPDVPAELHDRARDNWRPLLAIADAVGGPWPSLAREAAILLSGQAGDGDAPGVMLLIDLNVLFTERGVDRLASAEIVDALSTMEDRPWPEWRRGQPITARQLARLLKPFEIRPKKIRFDADTTAQGYELEDMVDAFSRYIPRPDPEHPEQSNNDAENRPSAIRNKGRDVPDRKQGEKRCGTTDVPDVPDGEPPVVDLFGNVEADHG
jgi:putative DNA primase/helicase